MADSSVHSVGQSERHDEPQHDQSRHDERERVLEVAGVSKSYGPESVIHDLSLSVADGEILTLLGPSGCGKTTTLRLIAGLERPDAGEIRIGGDVVSDATTHVAAERRNVGVVFQEFALFPHLTARENVAFGLKDASSEETERRVAELLELVGLGSQGESYPDELSGGQQQRVALARSIAPEPDILLLDEPFSNLDVDLRIEMREEVRRIIKEAGVTAVSVTHDQEEALSISDRVAVMNDGRIAQVGDPQQVFQNPTSRFVAGFLGYASFLPGYVTGDEVETDLGRIPRDQINGLVSEYDMTRIDVLVRPDDVRASVVEADGDPANENERTADARTADATSAATVDGGSVDGRVVGRRYLGPTILYEVTLGDGVSVECMHNHDEHVPMDAPVSLELQADHELAWFPGDQRPDGDDDETAREE